MVYIDKSAHYPFWGVLLFASLFMLIYPEHYVFLPFSTIWIIHLFGAITYFLHYIRFPKEVINKLIGYAVIISGIGFLVSNIFNNDGDWGLAKRGIQLILFVFDASWIVYLLKKVEGSVTFYALLKWLVYIAIVQAVISFVFFLYPSSYLWYRSLIIMSLDEDKTQILNSIRLMSVGDMRYATASVHYGFMMWAMIVLRKMNYSYLGKSSILFSLVVTIFVIAGLLSGRTFFIFVIFTIPFLYVLYGHKSLITLCQLLKIFAPVISLAILAFIYILVENEDMLSWLFELFINFSEGGYIESASTNDLKTMYIYPDSMKTWVIGDGKTINQYGGFYMSTDVGYIRSLFYWGIIGTTIYFIIQIKLYRLVKRLTCDQNIKCLCRFVVIWLFVYFFKDLFSIEKLMVLFIITLTYSRYNLPKANHGS